MSALYRVMSLTRAGFWLQPFFEYLLIVKKSNQVLRFLLPHFHIIQLLKLETLLIVKKSDQVPSFHLPHFQVIQLLRLEAWGYHGSLLIIQLSKLET